MQAIQVLKTPNPGQLSTALEKLKFGDAFKALIMPTLTEWTGLTNQATHQIMDSDGNLVPALIVDVVDSTTTLLTKIYTGAPAAGEVLITFDSDGYPELTFNAATTAFGIYGVIFPAESKTKQTEELL